MPHSYAEVIIDNNELRLCHLDCTVGIVAFFLDTMIEVRFLVNKVTGWQIFLELSVFSYHSFYRAFHFELIGNLLTNQC
jgi:hypothetical protein